MDTIQDTTYGVVCYEVEGLYVMCIWNSYTWLASSETDTEMPLKVKCCIV